MNIGFYINEMNFRGVAISTYQYALNNEKILKNKSIIFYNKKNLNNKKEIITKFKKKFKIIPVTQFNEINLYKKKFHLEYLYTQKSGNVDSWISDEIKTLVHCIYPQKLNQIHGFNYAYISEWLSKNFSNKKIPYIPLIIENKKSKSNLKKNLKIKRDQIVFGCHGGESSFDMKFAKAAIINIIKKRQDIIFLFLNIKKFINHPQIKFLKGTSNEDYKKKFINTCDAMIYGRSLGESFGIACGEFVIQNKKIISYKFNRHRSHEYNTSEKNFIEYHSYKSLSNILNNFKKNLHSKYNSKYENYVDKEVMKVFNKVFLKKNNIVKFGINDYFINYFNFMKMIYLYLRHKIYNHFFNYIESKLII